MGDIVVNAREPVTDEEKNKWLPAFARDVAMRISSSVQSGHWRITYHPNDVAGDKLTIEAIPPYHTVQAVMELLTDAISQLDKTEGKA